MGEAIVAAPQAFDKDAAAQLREAFGAGFSDLKKSEQALVCGVAGCSPYLRRLMQRDPALVTDILRAPPSASLERACGTARRAGEAPGEAERLSLLRRAKHEAALSIALADIAGVWDVMTAARAISDFADAAITAALSAASQGAGGDAEARGIAVIAMGKLGAKELNYSSDIDLVVVFDRKAMGVDDRAEAQKRAVKATRDMVNLLQMQTADGYVFRTDLRLRPDPGVSAAAISVEAAETYYEAFGQNWERMAYVKARAAAGDIALGGRFLGSLRPFVWRKYLDYAAIDDVKAVKRQIHSAKGGATIEFEGHDVKLGRGGIREIEFYAQTQQLILGGKNPELRKRATLEALAALHNAGHVSAPACEELSAAYCYLRTVEHRLQMINDEQTHAVPKGASDVDRLAVFLGEGKTDAFREKLLETFRTVERHFDDLFEDDTVEENKFGPLVFTGVNNDPATIETLKSLGFRRAEDVSATIRRWHTGTLRATRTERARVILTKLMNPLIEALSRAGDPDDAFFAFDDFLKRLPAGVQVFSLLASNLELFDTLIRIMTISPYLGRELSRRVNVIEQLIERKWTSAPEMSSYGPSIAAAIASVEDYEGALNAVRRWAGEQKFLVAAPLAVGVLTADEAAARFTAIADASISALYPAALEEMRRQHGVIDGALAIVGLGRLGAGEMTATSDIDLIFIYDADPGVLSDGEKPLGPTDYFARLVRRLVTALSTATEEGGLYEVDMQLRPSGRAGPAAVSLSAFRRYYDEDAWTWEMMALTKARIVAGAPGLSATVEQEIADILRRNRNASSVAADVHDMRLRLLDAKPAAGPWDVKNIAGGLTDISFLCQYLALVSAEKPRPPPRAAGAAIAWFAKAGVLDKEDATALGDARAMFDAILQAGRAATGGVFDPAAAGAALKARMASICGAGTIDAAELILTARQSNVAKIYHRVLGIPPGGNSGRE